RQLGATRREPGLRRVRHYGGADTQRGGGQLPPRDDPPASAPAQQQSLARRHLAGHRQGQFPPAAEEVGPEMSTLHRIRMPGSRPEPEGFLERFGEYAFRPLFLLLVLQALGMITLWVCWWTGLVTLPWTRDPLQWHVHEMLSGFAG